MTSCMTESKELPAAPESAVKARAARPKAAIMQVTEAAAARVKQILEGRGKPSLGIRVGVKARGCSGMTYTIEYADEKTEFDDVIEEKGITILIDPKATMFLLGTVMDYVEDKMQSGFTFKNPNEKGRCGCGESFHV